MARAALNWSLQHLAEVSGVHRNTISNFETGKYGAEPETLAAIQRALESGGVEFTNHGQAGVRMQKGLAGPRVVIAAVGETKHLMFREANGPHRSLTKREALKEAERARSRGDQELAKIIELAAAELKEPR